MSINLNSGAIIPHDLKMVNIDFLCALVLLVSKAEYSVVIERYFSIPALISLPMLRLNQVDGAILFNKEAIFC
ncbi:hypothetical protein [uncultured Legionella sp.]|uniref:hypothetical protein n=1 Tax=uncultured Legionella sp. TaxID=210934 RepID=UPI002628E598|nr:hypothetical protein [uncultured Legionella sp.]